MPPGRSRRDESRFREQAARLSIHLRRLRIAQGLTQEQLAAQAQVAVSTLRKIESGRVVEPGYFTVLALTSALGAQLVDLDSPQYRHLNPGHST